MPIPLRLLIVEDNVRDAEMVVFQLRKADFQPLFERVEDEEGFRAKLSPQVDVILCDFNLPRFNALQALTILLKSGLNIPFIVITGALGDELAVECVRRGADDYLLKDRLARLGPAIQEALELRRLRSHAEQHDATLVFMRRRLEQHMRDLEKLNTFFRYHLEERYAALQAVRAALPPLAGVAEELRRRGLDRASGQVHSIVERVQHAIPAEIEPVPKAG